MCAGVGLQRWLVRINPLAPRGNVEYTRERECLCTKIPQINSICISVTFCWSCNIAQGIKATWFQLKPLKGSHQYPGSYLSFSKANDLWFNTPSSDPALQILMGFPPLALWIRMQNNTKRQRRRRPKWAARCNQTESKLGDFTGK